MPKTCRVKVRTKRSNTTENSTNIDNPLPVDKSNLSGSSVNTSVSERKIKTIEISSPIYSSNIRGSRIIDMEIISSVINMLLCPSCKMGNMKLTEV